MKVFSHFVGTTKYTIRIGQNAKENWELIDNSDPFDLWFHLDDLTSSHVIISQDLHSNPEVFYPNEIISLAGNYCKTHSKQKKSPKVKIIYAKVSNLSKGKNVGSVTISDPKYIFI